tara:strand:+ start:5539 stop:6699 length:1161 start_codon:yes stop_codon:yes gene_type:complete
MASKNNAPQTIIAAQSERSVELMVQNAGVQAANVKNSSLNRETKQFTYSRKFIDKQQLKTLALEQEMKTNIEKSGVKSDSFFHMAMSNIDNKDYWGRVLDNANDKEVRAEASYNISQAVKKENKATVFAAAFKGWMAVYPKELQDNTFNKIGGMYSGAPENVGKWSKNVYKNFYIKNALVGVQLNKAGDKILKPVSYYQDDEGTVMGEVIGYKDFNILTEVMKQPVMIANLNKELRKRFIAMGYRGDNGMIKDEYLNFSDPNIEKSSKIMTNPSGVQTITRQIPIMSSASSNWIKAADQVLAGVFSALSDKSGFDNIQATYLSIAGEDKTSDEPLTYMNSKYQLSPESEQRVRRVYLKNAYADFMGHGYVEKKEFIQPKMAPHQKA